MEITKTIKMKRCDICNEQEGALLWRCLRCGKDICYDCQRGDKVVKYDHAVYFTGSDDGVYCLACNNLLLLNPDELFTAYLSVKVLREEYERFLEQFKSKVSAAEARLNNLLRERERGNR